VSNTALAQAVTANLGFVVSELLETLRIDSKVTAILLIACVVHFSAFHVWVAMKAIPGDDTLPYFLSRERGHTYI